MANYYVNLSFVVPVADPAATEARLRSLLTEDDLQSVDTSVIDHLDFDPEEAGLPETEAVEDGLWFHGFDPEIGVTAEIVQWVLRHVEGAPEKFGFSWAGTCDKERVNAFDGGAVLVTKDEILSMNTWEALDELNRRADEAA